VPEEDQRVVKSGQAQVTLPIMTDPEATPEMPGMEPPASADGDVKKQYAMDNPATEVGGGKQKAQFSAVVILMSIRGS